MKPRQAEWLHYAGDLVLDCDEQLQRITREQPDRVVMAKAALDEAVRVHFLLSRDELSDPALLEIAARLTKADLLTQALQRPLQ